MNREDSTGPWQLRIDVRVPGANTLRFEYPNVTTSIRMGASPNCDVRIRHRGAPQHLADVRVISTSLWVIDTSGGALTGGGRQIKEMELPFRRAVTFGVAQSNIAIEVTSNIADGSRGLPISQVIPKSQPAVSSSPALLLDEPLPTTSGSGGFAEITLTARGTRKTVTLGVNECIDIGRSHECDVVVPDQVDGVSRQHARIRWHVGWLLLEDMGSSNGTFMAGQKVRRAVFRGSKPYEIELGRSGASLSIRIIATPATRTESSSHGKDLAGTTTTPPSEQHPRVELEAAHDELRAQAKQLERYRAVIDEMVSQRLAADERAERARAEFDAQRQVMHWVHEELEARHESKTRERDTIPDLAIVALEETHDQTTLNEPPPSFAVEIIEPLWLLEVPEPDRMVIRHIAEYGHINEVEATQLLGGARQFRAFSKRWESHVTVCPFQIRIDTINGIKCYVRE